MASDRSSIEDRLDRLEGRLDRLEGAVDQLHSALRKADGEIQSGAAKDLPLEGSEAGGTTESFHHATGQETEAHGTGAASSPWMLSREWLRQMVGRILRTRSHDWLSYVGIGLLLFGLAFLFKYSVEQGWLVPEVRVGFGVLLGGALLVGGVRISDERSQLRQVLLGGSIATFYGTTFAAYQLYSLISYPVAFGSMVSVTILAIGMSLRQDHASIAVIGTLGGLGTPFLLYADVTGVAGLTVYTVVVLVGACAIYYYRGWSVVLYSAVSGGWLVLLYPCVDAALSGVRPNGAWALQVGIGTTWMLLSTATVSRSVLDQLVWTDGQLRAGSDCARSAPEDALYSLVPASPLAAIVASRLLWADVQGIWGVVAVFGALCYAGAYVGLRRLRLRRYAAVHGIVAATLVAYGLASWLGGAVLLLSWTVEAALLLIIGRRIDDTPLQFAGHAIFGIVAGWLGIRLAAVPSEAPAFAAASLSELAVIGIGLEATRRLRKWPGLVYAVLVLAGWLAWGRHVLVPLENGQAYVSAVWAATAALLLALGSTRRSTVVQSLGLSTLALFVCKLFLVDFAALPALWRIVLFLGAGGGFLLVSYALPDMGALFEGE